MRMLHFSKYQAIIVSVALFLVVDMGVLVMNFFIASQIQHDAAAVNLAGRQRMLSQRMAKTLYQLEGDSRNEQAAGERLDELKLTFNLFDTTLSAFTGGGEVKGGNGEQMYLPAVEHSQGQAILASAVSIWQPYRNQVQAVLLDPTPAIIQAAVGAAAANNLKLLKLMNDLTTHVEKTASNKAQTLRYVQAGGMVLAVLNFFLILFHFIKQLRRSDEALEEAKQETDQILLTVNQGLFLLDRTLQIGTQYSKELEKLFNREHLAHQDFKMLLSAHVSERTMQMVKDYLGVLLEKRVNAKLVADLNPLSRVEMNFQEPNGGLITKYLDFRFRRVFENDVISHILVTVSDTTEQVKLGQNLVHANERAEQQIKMVTELMLLDPIDLPDTIQRTRASLAEVNDILREPVRHHDAFVDKLNRVYRIVHRIKGDAGAVGLTLIESHAHQIENLFAELAQYGLLSGNDFLPATVQIERLLNLIDNIEDMVSRLADVRSAMRHVAAPVDDLSPTRRLSTLADRVASRSGKSVAVVTRGLEDCVLPERYCQDIQEVAQQFVRNAVAHGIETPATRHSLGKPKTGLVSISWGQQQDGGFELCVEDDGMGISLDQIRSRLIEQGLSLAAVDALEDGQLLEHLFAPGFSTRDNADEDAGRGVGLDAVREIAQKLGGKIRLHSRIGKLTRFHLQLPAALEVQLQARKAGI